MSSTATAMPWNRDMPRADAAPPDGARSILSKFGSGQTPDGTRLIRACGLSQPEVAQLAAMDFPNPSLPFRRVSIDPVRGVAVMMAPSRLHERIAARLDKVAEGLGGGARGGGLRVEQLRGTRWRDREGPQGAGAEADCAFYVGKTAEAYIRAEAARSNAGTAECVEARSAGKLGRKAGVQSYSALTSTAEPSPRPSPFQSMNIRGKDE